MPRYQVSVYRTIGPLVLISVCSLGMFGDDCLSHCHCYEGASCDTVTGECPNHKCATGWKGLNCSQGMYVCCNDKYLDRGKCLSATTLSICYNDKYWERGKCLSATLICIWIGVNVCLIQ